MFVTLIVRIATISAVATGAKRCSLARTILARVLLGVLAHLRDSPSSIALYEHHDDSCPQLLCLHFSDRVVMRVGEPRPVSRILCSSGLDRYLT